jgi:hypothetical protein
LAASSAPTSQAYNDKQHVFGALCNIARASSASHTNGQRPPRRATYDMSAQSNRSTSIAQ